jgi:hypothetical protein
MQKKPRKLLIQLQETLALYIKDLDFANQHIVARDGKRGNDHHSKARI